VVIRALTLPAAVLSAAVLGSGAAAADSGAISYWSDHPWPSLRSVRPDGSGSRLVYRTRQNAKRPVLSPDGRWIAFDGAPPGKPPLSDFDVQLVRPDGTGRRTIAAGAAKEIDPQWSPDGRLVSFSRSQAGLAGWSVWVVRPSDGMTRRLGAGQGARWSPDGRRIAFSRNAAPDHGDLFTMDVGGGHLRRLTDTPEHEEPAAYSTDGDHLLFTRYDDTGCGHVWVMAAKGGEAHRLTPSATCDVAGAFSPDGTRIVFTSERTGHPQLFVMRADGSGQRNISRNAFADFATGWR
jgi:Tol biopolymer transport system component